MKYLLLLLILSVSYVTSSSNDVTCIVDYTKSWPSSSQCDIHSQFSSTCSTIFMCLEFTNNATSLNPKTKNTVIELKTDNYYTLYDCVGETTIFPTSENVIFTTTLDYVNIICPDLFLDAIIESSKPTNIVLNNLHFVYTAQPEVGFGVISMSYSPSKYNGIAPTITIANSVVHYTYSSQYGGFIQGYNFNINLVNSVFSNCSSEFGGVVYSLGTNTTVSVSNCSFIGGYAYDYGGAIFGQSVYIENSKFIENSCYNSGGAVTSIKSAVIVNSTFTGNLVEHDKGGAIFSYGIVSTSSSTFHGNNGANGGVIYGADIWVDDCTFSNNEGGTGGAIFSVKKVIISRSTFSNNLGNYNGGVLALEGAATIMSSQFLNNIAYQNGGVIYSTSQLQITTYVLIDSFFTSNQANQGGVIYADGFSAFNLYNSVFNHNSAKTEAGALYMYTDQIGKISGGTFINSTASSESFFKMTQTFNNKMVRAIESVLVPSSIINSPVPETYYVPLVFDSNSAPYIRAYETESDQCVNGVATIDINGDVTSCTCFVGYSGPTCNISN